MLRLVNVNSVKSNLHTMKFALLNQVNAVFAISCSMKLICSTAGSLITANISHTELLKGSKRHQPTSSDEPATITSSEMGMITKKPVKKILQLPIAFSYNTKDDLQHAATKKKSDDGDHKSGGGKIHNSDDYSSNKEVGDKGYRSYHENEKKHQGHYDKESHKGSYTDEGGKKESDSEKHMYLKEHHDDNAVDKQSNFQETGNHIKGHSTKGGHSVNRDDHYEKKHEFFDEYYEDGKHKKYNGFHKEDRFNKGGSTKGTRNTSGYKTSKYAKKGNNENGKNNYEEKGREKKDGSKKHHKHSQKYGKKGYSKSGKDWSFKSDDSGKNDNHGSHTSLTEKQFNQNDKFKGADRNGREKTYVKSTQAFESLENLILSLQRNTADDDRIYTYKI